MEGAAHCFGSPFLPLYSHNLAYQCVLGSDPVTQSVVLRCSTVTPAGMASDMGSFCKVLPCPSLCARVRAGVCVCLHTPAYVGVCAHMPACAGACVVGT